MQLSETQVMQVALTLFYSGDFLSPSKCHCPVSHSVCECSRKTVLYSVTSSSDLENKCASAVVAVIYIPR